MSSLSYVYNTFRSKWLKEKINLTVDEVLSVVAFHIAQLANRYSPIGADALLSKSFYGEVVEHGKRADVASRLEYGEYVEFGTRPHWPPFEPIRQWVDAKVTQGQIDITLGGESTRALVKRRKHPPRSTERERKVAAIAFLIQRKIAERGTDPQGMLFKALKEAGVAGIDIMRTPTGLEYSGDLTPVLERLTPAFWDRITAAQ